MHVRRANLGSKERQAPMPINSAHRTGGMRSKPRTVARIRALTNHEIVTVAAFLLGAQFKPLDTEDIAVKASEIAPGRFAWRKYPQFIEKDNVRWALLDAKKAENGAWVIGSAKDDWLLTEAGVSAAKRLSKRLDASVGTGRRPRPREAWIAHEDLRLRSEAAFTKFAAGRVDEITKEEALRFFRLDDYVVARTRANRIQRLLNAFGDRPGVGQAVREIAKKVSVR